MNKTHKVHYAPMNKVGFEKGEIIKCVRSSDTVDLPIGKLMIADTNSILIINHNDWQAQQLVIIDEKAEIKVGDWIITPLYRNEEIIEMGLPSKCLENLNPNKYTLKVIASYPLLSGTLPITKIDVEYIIANQLTRVEVVMEGESYKQEWYQKEGTYKPTTPLLQDGFIYIIKQKKSLTYGEKAVGLTFNHGDGEIFTQVNNAKQTCAKAIDQMNDLRTRAGNGEFAALCTIAIRKLQSAQMDMVKAITWKD